MVVLDRDASSRRTRADSGGRFRFTRVSRGQHTLLVLSLGFQPDERTIDVPAEGLDVTVVMRQLVVRLDTIPVRASRTGIFGKVIQHPGLQPLGGAAVDVIGARVTARTGPSGDFNFPTVPAGAYVVRTKRNGYVSRMLSVVVPRDGGIELAVALDSGKSRDKALEMPLREFDERMQWGVKSRAAVIPRQELAGHLKAGLATALRYSPAFMLSGLVIDDAITCVYVDGLPRPLTVLDDFTAEEVEAVEVYGLRADFTNTLAKRWPRGGVCGNGGRPQHAVSRGSSGYNVGLGAGASSQRVPMDDIARAVVIWLKHGAP